MSRSRSTRSRARGAAKVMARPNGGGQTTGLGILAPSAAVTSPGRIDVTAGNPEIGPYRANPTTRIRVVLRRDSLLRRVVPRESTFVQIQRTRTISRKPPGLAARWRRYAAPRSRRDLSVGLAVQHAGQHDGGDVRARSAYRQFGFPRVRSVTWPDPELHRRRIGDHVFLTARGRPSAAVGQGRSHWPVEIRVQRHAVLGERQVECPRLGCTATSI